MQLKIPVVVIVCVLPFFSYSQNEDFPPPAQLDDGHFWMTRTSESKAVYVGALQNGWNYRTWLSLHQCPNQAEKILRPIAVLSTIDLTRPAIVQQINHFFGDSTNVEIPVAEALWFVSKRAYGETQESIENNVAMARRFWNKSSAERRLMR